MNISVQTKDYDVRTLDSNYGHYSNHLKIVIVKFPRFYKSGFTSLLQKIKSEISTIENHTY